MRRQRIANDLVGMALAAILAAASSAHAQTCQPSPSPAPQAAAAQSPQPSATPSLEKQFLRNLLRDQKAIWTSPFHLRASDVRWLAPLSAGSAGLFATDRRTGDAIARYPQLLNPSRRVSYAGPVYSAGGAALTFYLIGRATQNDRARETGLLGAEALIDGLIVVGVLKGLTQRARPMAGEERGRFFAGGSSFPSGHSIQAWSVATVIAHEYHDRRWVQVAAYAIAGAVSVSRFTGQQHYLSDVLVGGALGYGIGRYVYRAHHVERAGSGDGKSSRTRSLPWPLIAPQYDRHAGAYGVTFVWVF